MDPDPTPAIPKAGAGSSVSAEPGASCWPPGPRVALTGWSLLRAMSRDLVGALTGWQRQFGDIVHLRTWPEHEVIVTDPGLARELLVTHHDRLIRWERGIRVFARIHGHSVLVAEGEAWRHERQALQPAFSPKAEQAVHALSVAANGEFFWPLSWPDAMPWKRAKRDALATLAALVDRQVRARLSQSSGQRPDDLLTRLLRLHEADPAGWPLRSVRDECMTAFLAGHETAAASLTWWAWCMAANPQAQARAADEVRRHMPDRTPPAEALAELPVVDATLRETMRLYPAVPILFSRRSTGSVALGEWRLPSRTLFIVPIWLMQLDARWFPDPLSFRPERFDDAPMPRGAYLPFGVGPRVCLGQHLAMTEMRLIAVLLLQHYRLSIPTGQAAPEPVLNVTLRPRSPLHLDLRPVEQPAPMLYREPQ